MTRAPITPGIHPQQVRIVTIKNEPQPLSSTASGGKIIDNITLNSDIVHSFLYKLFINFNSFPLLLANPMPNFFLTRFPPSFIIYLDFYYYLCPWAVTSVAAWHCGKISVGYYSNVQKLAGRRTKLQNNGDAHLVWAFLVCNFRFPASTLNVGRGFVHLLYPKVLAGTLCLLAQRIKS